MRAVPLKKLLHGRKKCFCLVFLCLNTASLMAAEATNLTINGATDLLERNLRAHIDIPTASCETSKARLNRFIPRIKQDVERAARALGYYLIESSASFSEVESCWELNIDISPGEPVRLSAIDIDIRGEDRLFKNLLNGLPLEVGDQLDQQKYEQIKTRLSSRAVEVGFFSARFEKSQLLLDLEENAAQIAIDFNTGKRFRFGAVNLEPIEFLSESFVRRFVEFEQNTYYSSDSLINLRNSLSESQYFTNVTVTPALNANQGSSIPINVSLEPRPQRVYSTGAGLTTDIGPRVSLNYENRYLNPNGHKFKLGSRVSPIEQSADLNYTIPLAKPATESIRFVGGILREDNDTFKNQTFKLGSVYSFINRSKWRQNYSVNFQHDQFEISDQDEVANLLIAGFSLAKTQANDALYPTKGWRLFGQVRGASSSLFSTETFLQFNASGKWITKLGPGRLLSKFELGATLVNDVSELPVSVQYFAGGDQSVRGYRYQSLGPVNESADVIGGKHLIVAGVEYDFTILPDWKLALFADAGNAFSDFGELELQKSIGLGVRWLSPIGPIRIDFASALDDDNKFRMHITMGPDL
jgi:translocation and assembly module TamA